jgi:nucleoside-diphosphate-sugar epimerase
MALSVLPSRRRNELPQSERVVIVGGAGFIGKRLTALLANQGCHVVVVSRSSGGRRSNDPRIEYQSGNVTDRDRMSELVSGASVVYNLAVSAGRLWADWERELIAGDMNLADACLEKGVRRLIYTSTTAAIYLGGPGTVTEATLGNEASRKDRGDYCKAKSIVENKLIELHRTRKLPVVILRPAVVMGPGGMMVHPALGDRVSDIHLLGFGRGNTPLPCVLVDDVAQALLLAKDAPEIDGMTFNLAGDVRPSAAEFVDILRKRTKRNFQFHPRSMWNICGAELGRYLIKKVVRKPDNRMVPFRDLRSASLVTQLDCSLAKQKLGWKPVADQEEFYRQAVDVFVRPIPPGDVRLEAAA